MRIQVEISDDDARFLRREGVEDIERWTRTLVESEIAIMRCFPFPDPNEVRADPAGNDLERVVTRGSPPPAPRDDDAGGKVVRLADFRRSR